MIYDPTDGLYRGGQSFLDWREQSYASWCKEDVLAISLSKALSTNVLHYEALRLTARLTAMLGCDGQRYHHWADQQASACPAWNASS
ncbi:MAG: hypothetical protein ACOH5I_10290 [Oligoflexus sp.]